MHIALTHRKAPCRFRPDRPARRQLPRRRMLAAGVVSALLLSGCAGVSSPDTTGEVAAGSVSSDRGGTQPNAASADKSVVGAPGDAADVARPGTPVVGVAPKVTKSASLDLQVTDINAAAAQVRSIAAGLQTLVLSEQIGKADPPNMQAPQPLKGGKEPFGGFGTLTLSVPADKLDTALDQLAKVGTVLRRNASSQDVTSQYVDTEGRLKTMRASVERVRALMAQAKDLGQVVALESEMSRREADLESLASQLEALNTGIARSTLAVSLSTPVHQAEAAAANGFLVGLRSGWDAFTTSAKGLFTAVGAVLPFAVFLALVSAPLWFWWRRRANQPSVAEEPDALSGQPAVTPAAP